MSSTILLAADGWTIKFVRPTPHAAGSRLLCLLIFLLLDPALPLDAPVALRGDRRLRLLANAPLQTLRSERRAGPRYTFGSESPRPVFAGYILAPARALGYDGIGDGRVEGAPGWHSRSVGAAHLGPPARLPLCPGLFQPSACPPLHARSPAGSHG